MNTHLALIATLAELHRQPIAYDLTCLCALVARIAPDLLCAEITQEAWEGHNLSNAALEVRAALARVIDSTDTVLVPIAPDAKRYDDFQTKRTHRNRLAQALNRLFNQAVRIANRPEAINGPVFEAFCHLICALIERTWTSRDRRAWLAQNEAMARLIIQAVQRDPGRRVLVAVQCQRVHRIAPMLQTISPTIDVVKFWEL